MKTKIIIVGLIGLLVATIAIAQPMNAPGRMHQPEMKCLPKGLDIGPMGRCLQGLDLTDQQKQDIEKLALEHQKKMVEQRAKMAELHSRMKLALTADKTNPKEIDELAAKIGKYHEEQARLRAGNLRKIRDLLTVEQRITFDRNVLSMGGPGKGKMMMGKCQGARHCGTGLGMMGGCCGIGPCAEDDDDRPGPQ